VVADLPGVARFRAWGPTGSIEQYRSEQAGAERRIKALTEAFGTADLEELENFGQRAEELDKKIAEATTQLETLLSGMSIDDIRRESSRIEAVLTKSLEHHPDWKHSIPDGEALKAAAQESSRSSIEKVEGAEARKDQAQSALAAAITQRADVAAQLKETRAHLRSLESRLAELTSDGKTDREREDELKKMALAWELESPLNRLRCGRKSRNRQSLLKTFLVVRRNRFTLLLASHWRKCWQKRSVSL
jgi:chromosome segregation ATPase